MKPCHSPAHVMLNLSRHKTVGIKVAHLQHPFDNLAGVYIYSAQSLQTLYIFKQLENNCVKGLQSQSLKNSPDIFTHSEFNPKISE